MNSIPCIYQRLSIQHGFYHAIRRFWMWLFAVATRLAINWESLTHGGGCRWFDGAVSLAAPRVVSMTTPGAANVIGVIRWTTLPFWRTSHPKAGWVVATVITRKTQRSIESLDVDKGRHAKNHSHGCTSKHEFIRCIWRWVTLSADRIFMPDAILSVGYVTSHAKRGWEIIHMTSQARNTRHTDTQLIDCFELFFFYSLCVFIQMLIILIVFPLNNNKLAKCFKFHIVSSQITVTQSGPKSMTCSHGRNILIIHSSKSQNASLSFRSTGVMAEINLQIFSLNCNGLSDDARRNAVFSKLKRSAAEIYLLQETHSTSRIEKRWQHEWGNKNMYFSHGIPNSRGVAIIITNNYGANTVNIRRDTEGRILIIDLKRYGTTWKTNIQS